ncbi:GntR family transcriptional regulator [Desulfobacula sp.]|uniref:FadR/GntR family transcriptional regulator n=1 Tax=Desulfobacula sp. TaxID=2593537 RepID=UPI0026365664|nr:GntR family transcriptional regulator [Desulfobacula sp.]
MAKLNHPIFHPVTSANKPEAIGLQIEAAISDRTYTSGDRLPSERELQEAFKTSRGSVREALRTLRQKGMLEAKKGAKGGYYVRELDINEAVDNLAVMIKQQEMPLDKLLEFQYAMDQAILIPAVTNASKAQVRRMTQLADQLLDLCNVKDPDFQQISAVDKALNLLMVEMADNPFFEWMMRSVQLAFRSYEFVIYQTPEVRLETARNWKSTAEAVRDRDLQKANRLYGHWYILLEQCLKERFGETLVEKSDHLSLTGL